MGRPAGSAFGRSRISAVPLLGLALPQVFPQGGGQALFPVTSGTGLQFWGLASTRHGATLPGECGEVKAAGARPERHPGARTGTFNKALTPTGYAGAGLKKPGKCLRNTLAIANNRWHVPPASGRCPPVPP